MKKAIAWVLGFAILLIIWFSGITGAAFAILGLIVLSAISWILGFFAVNHISVDVQGPGSAEKNTEFPVTVSIHNRSWIPCGPVKCVITAGNTLTDEIQTFSIRASAAPRGTASDCGRLICNHCGHLVIAVQSFCVMDWFGILHGKKVPGGSTAVSILPSLFPTHVAVSVPPASPEDSIDYAQDKAGSDFAETYQIREYKEGDSLRAIHWKLTGKFNRLIVREPSYPIAKSLLVYWDKTSGNPSPEEMDAMAEVAGSLCRSLTDQGTPYHFGWNEEGGAILEQILDEGDFLRIVPRMIRNNGGKEENGCATLLRVLKQSQFGRVVYIGSAIPPESTNLTENLSAITFGRGASNAPCPTVEIRINHFAEDLQFLELGS